MGTFKKKMAYLFLRKIAFYLVLLCVTTILMSLIAAMSYHSTRENILSSHADSISKGLSNLDSQIHSIIGISRIIANDKNYQSLLSVSGTPDNPDYVTINTLQKQLASLSLAHEYIMDMYILFRNNRIYVSNFICADDYSSVFPNFLRDESLTANQWHELLLTDSSINQIDFFSNTVYSYYTQPHSYSALTCVMRVTPYSSLRKDGILVCNLDFDQIVNNMVQPTILDDCFLYITDINNSIIGSHNFFLEAPIEGDYYKTDTNRYSIVRSEPSDYGFSVVLGIPENYFSDTIRSSFFTIECYFLISLILIILLYLFLLLREAVSMRRVVNTSSSLFPIPEEIGKRQNEYTYISHVLDHNASTLDSLNYQLKTVTLINLFLNDTQHDEDHIKKLFDISFDAYHIATIKLVKHNESDIDQHYLIDLEELVNSVINLPFLSVHTNANELSLLLVLDDFHFRNPASISAELRKMLDLIQKTTGKNTIIHIGLSGVSSGIEHIHEAYLQAKDIINISANPEASDIFVYDRPRQFIHHKTMDIPILLKCYDGILCGDTKVIDKFFNEVEKMTKKGYYDLQEPLQFLFSVRQPIYNAYLEIFSAGEMNQMPLDLKPPIVDQHLSLAQNIAALKDFSYQLCEQTQLQKQSRQLKLKENILNYIGTNCFDVNFSVYTVMNEFHVSENFVLQLVKESTRKSFKNYVEGLRVDKADHMLMNTNETNADIALACGFGSETTFYRAFARKHGVTPSKWSNKS